MEQGKRGFKKYWRWLKPMLALVIIAAVGRRFWLDLSAHPEIWELELRPGWLALSVLFYIGGLGFPVLYWFRLLRRLDQQPVVACAIRAYYVGTLGKYVPGKAWALFLRATLAGPGVSLGIATMSAFYEVLVTMCAGSLLALLLFLVLAPRGAVPLDGSIVMSLVQLQAPAAPLDRWVLVALAAGLVLPIVVPIWPDIFNRIVDRLSLPFRDKDTSLPKVSQAAFFEGLAITTGLWLCMGASLVCALQGAAPVALDFSVRGYGMLTAGMSLAYVAGFVILVVPSGLGVREFFLTLFLVPELAALESVDDARALAVIVVLLLRLLWTVGEVIAAGVCYLLPVPGA